MIFSRPDLVAATGCGLICCRCRRRRALRVSDEVIIVAVGVVVVVVVVVVVAVVVIAVLPIADPSLWLKAETSSNCVVAFGEVQDEGTLSAQSHSGYHES